MYFFNIVLRLCPYTEVQKTFCDKLEATSIKEIIDKLEFNKINTYCSSEDYVRRMRRQVTNWEKIFANKQTKKHHMKDCYWKCTKKLLILNNKKTTNPIKN